MRIRLAGLSLRDVQGSGAFSDLSTTSEPSYKEYDSSIDALLQGEDLVGNTNVAQSSINGEYS